MKNASYVILVLTLIFLTSCGKKDATSSHGTWSMKGINYSVKSCGFVDDVMYATDGTTDTLFIVFANNVPPTATGDYRMQFATPGAGEASVQIYFHGQYYLPASTTEYIRATVANGKVSATGTNIHVADPNTPYDIATVVFNITQ